MTAGYETGAQLFLMVCSQANIDKSSIKFISEILINIINIVSTLVGKNRRRVLDKRSKYFHNLVYLKQISYDIVDAINKMLHY